MRSVSKSLTLIFVVLLLSSLMVLTVEPVNAQKPPKPSVPTFSVKLVSHPYNVPPTTTSTFDSSTWKEITTTVPGYRVENRSIEISIKNQPFKPYTIQTSASDYDVKLDYIVEYRNSFDNDQSWKNLYWRGFQQTAQYTVLSCFPRNIGLDPTGHNDDFPVGVQVEFRVQARIGCWAVLTPLDYLHGSREPYLTEAELSDWSGIQTITITKGSSSSSPTHTPTLPVNPPTIPEGNQSLPDKPQPTFVRHTILILGLSLLFVGVIVTAVLVFRQQLKTSNYNINISQSWRHYSFFAITTITVYLTN